ncbi:hypothetical protein K9M78_08305 [Candidatus Bipolaricaulota bacterium]|nr:hypothetical protein [Candidatus Bipolaricaulota bacterium]
MKENKFSITVVLVCILISALALSSISSQSNKENNEITVKKEVYYEKESSIQELPQFPELTGEKLDSYLEPFSKHKYGIDEN